MAKKAKQLVTPLRYLSSVVVFPELKNLVLAFVGMPRISLCLTSPSNEIKNKGHTLVYVRLNKSISVFYCV